MKLEHVKLVQDVLRKAFNATYAHGEYPYDFEWGLAFKALEDALADQPAPTETEQTCSCGFIGTGHVLPSGKCPAAPQGAPWSAASPDVRTVETPIGQFACPTCGADYIHTHDAQGGPVPPRGVVEYLEQQWALVSGLKAALEKLGRRPTLEPPPPGQPSKGSL